MTLKNPLGLSFEFLDTGVPASIQAAPIRLSLKAATSFSRPGTNLYLRKRKAPFDFAALLGPESHSRFQLTADAFVAQGTWAGLQYECRLRLSRKSLSWEWSVQLTNPSARAVELELLYVQDVGLKPLNAGLLNEYYVSQYLERRILLDPTYGAVACCRQNMAEPTGHPWLMLACRNRAAAGTVDGMQFYGRSSRETGVPEGLLSDGPGGDYAGESSVFSLRESSFTLSPGETRQSAFVGTYLPDHPQATSAEDLARLPGLMREFEDRPPEPLTGEWAAPAQNLFQTVPFLPVDDLTKEELDRFFGPERRHGDYAEERLLSFFSGESNHVVLRAKEVRTDRPHAHILQARAGYVPHDSVMSTTCFAFGVFNSHLTQGNTNFNVLLSVCTSPFNLAPETGQRIFVTVEGKRFLLGVPSAFEMGLNHCRWLYKHGPHCFQVRSWTCRAAPQINLDFRVLQGGPVDVLLVHDFDPLPGWTVRPGSPAGEWVAQPRKDSLLAGQFPQARFRFLRNGPAADFRARGAEALALRPAGDDGSLFVLEVRETAAFCLSFLGEVSGPAKPLIFEDPERQWLADCREARTAWHKLSLNLSLRGGQQRVFMKGVGTARPQSRSLGGSSKPGTRPSPPLHSRLPEDALGDQEDIAAIREILPWYGMNALTHFLTPYGLEQFSGAAWGTRDVAQGPMDLLLHLQQHDAARQVLRIIFSNQEPEGGWPQWWMFDAYANVRAAGSHGDVPYWCLLALANYLQATGDFQLLEEVLPYYPAGRAERTPLYEHVERLLQKIIASFLPGTALVPFGGGDWNDSLQPVSEDLARRLISSWTVEMNYQAFAQCRWLFERRGALARAAELQQLCDAIRADFNRHLVKDGVVAGYGLVEADGRISLLLHPSDTRTGLHYSLLPMNRGVLSGIFTPEQAQHHQQLIEAHLKGPDGARLMDRPLPYKGGLQTLFQRAESSSFFGREIGLMYMHEHLRYAEALARTGQAEAFLKALRQAIPVNYQQIVPCGDLRQSNCYYTSSDVVFRNRYEADQGYEALKTGALPLRGGWRVYSSGPGIFIALVVSQLLGLRLQAEHVIFDPVLPASLDGLSVSLDLLGRAVTLSYGVRTGSFGPKELWINGQAVPFASEPNPYRQGGAVLAKKHLLALLERERNLVTVIL